MDPISHEPWNVLDPKLKIVVGSKTYYLPTLVTWLNMCKQDRKQPIDPLTNLPFTDDEFAQIKQLCIDREHGVPHTVRTLLWTFAHSPEKYDSDPLRLGWLNTFAQFERSYMRPRPLPSSLPVWYIDILDFMSSNKGHINHADFDGDEMNTYDIEIGKTLQIVSMFVTPPLQPQPQPQHQFQHAIVLATTNRVSDIPVTPSRSNKHSVKQQRRDIARQRRHQAKSQRMRQKRR